MRILLLSPYWTPVHGGISRYAAEICRELAAAGHEVRVIALQGEPERDVTVMGRTGLAKWHRIYRAIRLFRPDIIHVNAHWALLVPSLLAKLLTHRMRVIYTFHTAPQTAGLRKWLFSLLLNRCDFVTAVSGDLLGRMARHFRLRVPIARTPPGARPPASATALQASFRESLSIPPRAPLLLAVSPLQYSRKVEGIADLIRALPRLLETDASVHLTIVGDGAFRSYLEAIIRELRLEARVHLIGALADPGWALRDATVFCHVSYQDELPHALLEAMAHGLPIVCSPVGGIPEVVRDGLEALFVEGGVDAIAERTSSLLADIELQRWLGAHAFERLRTAYTWDAAARHVLNLYGVPGRKFLHISIDVEEDYNTEGSEYRGVTEELPRILELLRRHAVPASFFVTAEVATRFPELIRRIIAEGHEVGSHGTSHKDPSFASLPSERQREFLKASAGVLASQDILPVAFRAPNFRVNAETFRSLALLAWTADSSVVSGRRVRRTRESPRIDFCGAPLATYRPSERSPREIGRSGLLEVPVASNPLARGSPLGLGYLNTVGPKETGKIVASYPSDKIVFLLHSWEALDYEPRPSLAKWMLSGCTSDLSNLEAFLEDAHRAHSFVTFRSLLTSPLELNPRGRR